MDVGSWLQSLGLEQYEALFRENDIDAEVVGDLTDADLEKLGVTLGHRKRLLKAIASLGPREPAAKPTRPPPLSSSTDGAERRPITVMFCDLVGSTSLAAKLDAEDWRNLVNAYLDQASAAVTDFGGHVLKKLGDGLMALFGYPQAQENDAERAVRASLAIQRAISDLNNRNGAKCAPELSARIGIESGPVVVEASGEVFGDAPNIAARVQAEAEPGSVLITLNVQRQVAGLFVAEEQSARELKGVSQPVQLFRIVRASGGGRRAGARTLTPFVGREEELVLLGRRWERARVGEGQVVLVVGEPGLGKSRLIEEFHARLTETPHTWVEWSASQLLQNTPLHPIAEWGRLRFGADAPAEQRLADLEGTLRLIGLDPTEHAPLVAPLVDIPLPPSRAANFSPEELRRRQLTAMASWVLAGARSQPAVVAFEDLHWADPTSLDLLRALADRGAQAPLLLLATTRPEFRPPWSLRSHHSLISLSPLDRAGVARMIGEISASHALSNELIAGVNERTGGVPLFVEEVTRLLLERGEQGGAQAIPPTLQQSLAARLDRLGPAREVAQIGAVLGRDFVYALLRDVAEIDESALQASLDRLADADLLIVEGSPPQANYRFKHALIQDAAYDSLLKSRRQALHRRAGEILLDQPARAAEPEAIAHHFTQAGLDDLAIEWWGKAGDQALRRSAFQEAIAHLGKAIEMADKAGEVSQPGSKDDEAASQRLRLQTDYGQAVMWSKGFAAAETKAAFARASELAANTDNFAARFATGHSQWASAMVRGEQRRARELASSFLKEAEDAGRLVEVGVARRGLAQACYLSGEFLEARTHCERALDACDPEREKETRERFTDDTGPIAISHLAMTMWQLGEPDRARELIDEANRRARDLGHAPSMAHPLNWRSRLEILRGEAAATLSAAETLAGLCREHGMPFWRVKAELDTEWARGRLYDAAAGVENLRRTLAAAADQGMTGDAWFYTVLLAELEAETLGVDNALKRIDEALVLARQVDDRCDFAFPHLLRGELLLKRDPSNPAPAEEAFQTALAIAKKQCARSWGLRAALSLAKLYQSTSRPADAHAVLTPALEGFSPTPEMPEIAEARALLGELAETDEVKGEAARRQRLTQLHTARGIALFAARGGGAPETTAAFASAREQTFGDEATSERFVADFGLWVGSYVRGELPSMRAHAAAFLNDVAAKPESPEAGVAHRTAGITCWFAGEYREARDHLERALALFEPGRDDDLTFRFGLDPGIATMVNLANASWPLGEVDRAISLIDRAQLRSADFTHAGVLAFARMHSALFDLMRRDHVRAAPRASELARITREHDLTMYGAFGAFLESWATDAGGAPGDGLWDMRQAVDELRGQNVLLFDGLLKIALAEAEARAGDPDRAVALVDEALVTAERTGYRAFEAELHRARGYALLMRDPANSAPAEEAFLTAIALARQQETRSFGLRAALSLARLYQSTGRAAEAHTVLAPTLESFTPTPAMPEIAEAQALLAALAEMDEVKSAEGQRQRRLHLQTAYGQAMMWSKGFAAEETKAAFARTAKLAGKTDDFSERFIALQGQFAAASTRGELRSARELASTLLREAGDAEQLTEAGFANFWLGLIAYWHGDFVDSRTYSELALDAGDPNLDPKDVERFGDIRTWTSAHLAATMWQLGEVERARELIDWATKRASEVGHIGGLADALFFKSYLEIWRGDPVATLSAAVALEAVAREHGMVQYLNEAELHSGWARGRIDDPIGGVAQVRRVLTTFAEQGVRVNLGFYNGLLAQLEAETLGADSALARIEEAFALSHDVEHRCSLPFLHRLRGEFLLKRDPPDTALTEEAFVASIAIAKEQGARSPVLLASLSLAKLYQSSSRPADADAILAPALEGFAPTPAMPEIAEAQALLAAIEAGAHVRRV